MIKESHTPLSPPPHRTAPSSRAFRLHLQGRHGDLETPQSGGGAPIAEGFTELEPGMEVPVGCHLNRHGPVQKQAADRSEGWTLQSGWTGPAEWTLSRIHAPLLQRHNEV